ncbi:MAG: hypothetical protein DLD55_05025 [candidate division SR1 bacterium]|nr:MAG: hypothetical protein DLD55_05025 [candidate division SR1 bacterium]
MREDFISHKRMSVERNAPKLGLQYSDSNDFFPENIDFLQKIGFVSILSIDMDIKYSFQKANRATIIQGAEIDTYDNDHTINDSFFVHKMTLPRETSITRSLLYIKLNQQKSVSLKDIISFIRSFPMVSLLIFTLISLFIPGKFGDILQIINVIALLIFILFFAFKFTKYFFELTKTNSKALQDHIVTYLNPYDLRIFTKEVKEKIGSLQKFGVTDLAIDRNTLYLKQDLLDESQTSIFGQLLGKRKVFDEKTKEKIMNGMIDLLSEPIFLDIFRGNGD